MYLFNLQCKTTKNSSLNQRLKFYNKPAFLFGDCWQLDLKNILY